MADSKPITSDIQSQLPPEDLVTRVWQELTRATKDHHHHWRTPALASIGVDGHSKVRTVVLRQANPSMWSLQAFTDSRSPKCRELEKHNHAQLAFWNPKLKWQLRVAVSAKVHTAGEMVDVAWSRMRQSASSKDYLSLQAPGSTLLSRDVYEQIPSDISNHHHLAVINFQVISMDWLALTKDIHRRALIDPSGCVTALTP